MLRETQNYSIKYILTEVQEDIRDFFPEYQRLYVWNKERQSKFIRHILNGYPTHKIFIDNMGDYWQVLDGQQRITTVYNYVNGDFKLDNAGRNIESDWNGKYFHELDKKEQKRIMDYTLTCDMIEEATKEEIQGLFDGLNSGMPLGKITEILLTKLEVKEIINKVKKYPFISSVIEDMSDNNISKQEDDLLVLRILALFTVGIINLDGAGLEGFLSSAEISQIDNATKDIHETCVYMKNLYSNEFFGQRRLIPCHSIPSYMLFANEHRKQINDFKDFSKIHNRFISKKGNREEFKNMNKSETSCLAKQIRRMNFYKTL